MTKYRSGNNKYDAIGNPTQYYNGRTYKMTWQGRELQSLTLNGVKTEFTYNADGLRINKTTGGVSHDYIWSGDTLLAEVTAEYTLRFLYDGSGNIIGFEHITASTTDTDITYYYEKNIFGDVIAIYAENGTKVASYAYNAYGQCHVLDDLTSEEIGSLNPIRYRSYYSDTDIYLYYLQSRYYDTVACRFINADTYINANGDIVGYNMFAYCSNNPVMFTDPTGESVTATVIVASLVISGTLSFGFSLLGSFLDKGYIEDKDWAEAGVSAAFGVLTTGLCFALPAHAIAISAGSSAVESFVDDYFFEGERNVGVIVMNMLVSAGLGAITQSWNEDMNSKMFTKLFDSGDELVESGAKYLKNIPTKGSVNPAAKAFNRARASMNRSFIYFAKEMGIEVGRSTLISAFAFGVSFGTSKIAEQYYGT